MTDNDNDNELCTALLPLPAAAQEEDDESPRPGLPEIEVYDRHRRDITRDVARAMARANDPLQWFAVDGLPVGLVRRVDARGVPQRPTVEPITPQGWTALLHQAANFRKTTKNDSVLVDAPSGSVNHLYGLKRFDEFLPELRGVITSPIFTRAGILVATPGYHAPSGLFYAPPGDEPPIPMPKAATGYNIREAVALLSDELLGDFPFVDAAAQAHALALSLLGFARPLIAGITPLHVLTAPKVEGPGTGKSLLAQVTAAPSAPEGVSFMPWPAGSEEQRKGLTTALRPWPTHLILDNIAQPLSGGVLAAALTAEKWADRIIGTSNQANIVVRCAWVATGNGVRASKEIQRRICWVRLDAGVADPTKRTGFKHSPLLPWVRENRPRLGQAALTIIQGWLDAGRPMGEKTLASYEEWSQVMGGILAFAGVEGFLADSAHEADPGDPDNALWAELVDLWQDLYGRAEVTSSQLFDLAQAWPQLSPLTGSGPLHARKVYFGGRLALQAGETYGGAKIVPTRQVQHSWRYRLELV